MKKLVGPIILLLIIFLISKGWWNTQFASVSSDQSKKVFIIEKGIGVSDIAKKLKKDNLIKSELAFKIYVNQNNLKDKLQAGSYKLSPSMSLEELIKNLQTGSEDVWVTLIEGWRVEEIAEKLNKELKIDNGEFIKQAKEGYMFPDTYLFPKEATVSYIADTLKKTFNNRFTDDLRSRIRSQGLSEAQGVILASLVEREGRSDKVRTEIAGIMLKRLNMGMKLDLDATVQYIVGYQPAEKSWWKRHISREDKAIQSLYNTYASPGLPPAPICNPSLASLNAVANANAQTPYLYYYHDLQGNSYYSKTLEEHNQNVANNP